VAVKPEDKPKTDGEATPSETPKPAATPAAAAPPKAMTIDFDGISRRVARVPIGADNYGGISAKPGFLIYGVGPAFYYGRAGDRPGQLKMFSLKDRKETTLIDDFGGGYALSRDGSKVLARTAQGFGLYDATPTGDKSRKPVATTGLVVDRVPVEEWNQIFNEVWRRYRDFFYVPNMHGYDWVALREQYKPLLQYVAHRSDLNYVISEMISELTIQHAYIEGGDFQIPPRPRVGLPGARFELDRAAGRYRISKILEGQNEEERKTKDGALGRAVEAPQAQRRPKTREPPPTEREQGGRCEPRQQEESDSRDGVASSGSIAKKCNPRIEKIGGRWNALCVLLEHQVLGGP